MLFPKKKIGFTSTYQGNRSEEGWLVLDIGNLELDGVTKLYIDMHDVEETKARKSKGSDSVSEIRKLLGGD
jgi:hypothetical protein